MSYTRDEQGNIVRKGLFGKFKIVKENPVPPPVIPPVPAPQPLPDNKPPEGSETKLGDAVVTVQDYLEGIISNQKAIYDRLKRIEESLSVEEEYDEDDEGFDDEPLPPPTPTADEPKVRKKPVKRVGRPKKVIR